MQSSNSQARWIPAVLCVVVADLNFWYWASTGETDLDYGGMLFFFGAAIFWLRRFRNTRESGDVVCIFGAIAALGLMVLRETETWNRGYIPPYLVFLAFVAVASRSWRRPADPPDASKEPA